MKRAFVEAIRKGVKDVTWNAIDDGIIGVVGSGGLPESGQAIGTPQGRGSQHRAARWEHPARALKQSTWQFKAACSPVAEWADC